MIYNGGGDGGSRSDAERQWWLRRMYAQQIHARALHYYSKSSWESCLFISIIFGALFLVFIGVAIVGATNNNHNHNNHGHGDDWWTKDVSGLATLEEQMRGSTDNAFVYRPYACERKGKPFARHSLERDPPSSSSGFAGGKGSSSSSSFLPKQEKLLSPREISNRVCNRSVYQTTPQRAHADQTSLDFFRPNKAHLSNFVWVWGQFVQQCIVSTEAGGNKLTLNFTGDSHFDPRKAGYIVELEGAKSVGQDAVGRQILSNTLSPLLDGSCVYGSDRDVSMALRTQEGGKLRMTRSMSDEAILSMDDRRRLFVAGDPRVNENVPLTAIYTLWTREHNSMASILAEIHPDWKDEHIYWLARRIVTAEIQSITYNEWLPALFGGEDRVPPLEPEAPVRDDGTALSLAFSVVAFRAAHSMVPDALPLISPGVGGVVDILPLHSMFMNPELIRKGGIDAVLAGIAASPMEEVDVVYADSLRNALFVGGPSRDLKLDLASLDISRGRESNIGSYGELRRALGLGAPKRWSEITKDPLLLQQLKKAYPGGPASMDPLIGMLAEDHLRLEDSDGDECVSPLPPTMAAVWKQEFADVRNGDRFYYEVDPGMEYLRDIITQTRLHHIILRNTNIAESVLLGKAAPTHVLPPGELLKLRHKEAKKRKKKGHHHRHHHKKNKKKRKRHHHHHHGEDSDEYEKNINEGKKTDTSLFFTNGRMDDLYYHSPVPLVPPSPIVDKKTKKGKKKRR